MKHLHSLMATHFAAFQAKADILCAYEKREDPSIKSVADALDKIATAFDEYKKVNDQRIEAVKTQKPTADIDAKLAKMDEHMGAITEAKTRLEAVERKLARPGMTTTGEKGTTPEADAYKNAFFSWVRNPTNSERSSLLQQRAKELRESKATGDDFESRSVQATTLTGAAGGFALPEVIERQIARLSVDISPIRGISTVRTVGSPDYKELFDVNGAGFEWIGETDPRAQTTTGDLAEVAPTFGMASAKPQASEESLDDLFFDVEQWVIESASEAIAQGEGAAFIAGSGVKRPTGILAGPVPVVTGDATRAFGTLQYIASGQIGAMPTSADTFLDMVYGIRARYRNNAKWLTNKLVLSSMRKYKDTAGQYLWQPSVQASEPSLFLGYPVVEAEDMPVVVANAFPLAFGDFKEGYLIADRVGMRMTRDEITTPGFVKFYIRKRVGGKLRNTQAIKLLKIATA